MNQNYAVLNWNKIHSEFTDNKGVDGQILPTNFALIHMAFLLLTHKEHRKLARNETNWRTSWTCGQEGTKNHTEFWWINNIYKSIPVTARSKVWGLRSLACWDCEFEYRRGHGYFLFECCIFRYRFLRRADHSCRGVIQTEMCPLSVIAKPRPGKP
jgi:hypothetical protein